MASIDINVSKELLPDLLGSQDGLAKLVEVVLNQILEAQVLVFQAADLPEARRRLAAFSERFAKTAPKAVACLEAGFEDAMAVMALPEKYRKRLRTTNMQERLNEEVRRRERVIRIFPNDELALRLIGALLAEKNDQWLER